MWVKFQVNFLVLKTLSWSCSYHGVYLSVLEYVLHHLSIRVPHNLKHVPVFIKVL